MDRSLENTALHKHALAALEAADMALAYADMSHLKEVHRFDQITAEWLTEVLTKDAPGAKCLEVNRKGGHEGMTSRHELALTWNDEGKNAGLPVNLFVKATPENAHLLEMLSMLHMAELECEFYNKAAATVQEHVPKCYFAKSYPGGRFIMLLETLEDRGIKPYWMGYTPEIAFTKQVAIVQAKIHAAFWDSPRFAEDLVFVRPRVRRFGQNWMEALFHKVRKMFLASEIGRECPEYVRNLVQYWDEHCDKIWAYYDTKPATIVHGDSHLGNVMEFANGTAGHYDWQCLFRSYGIRDLAYHVMSGLTVDEVKAHERDIFDLYVDTLAENGVKIDREEAWLDYTVLCLDRFDSAMTSLSLGGYGHARSALERQVKTLTYITQSRDVTALLERIVTTNSVLGTNGTNGTNGLV